jgi:hypothetical protein
MRGIVGTDSGNDAEDENDSHRASLLRHFLGTPFSLSAWISKFVNRRTQPLFVK